MARVPNEIGEVRQSAVLLNYGPGAVIDFRAPDSGAAVSVVAAGIEQWELQAQEAGANPSDFRRFQDRRLCEKLGVTHFRLPPIAPDKKDTGSETPIPLVGARFPSWLQCPKCDLLQAAKKWASEPGKPSRYCPTCSQNLPGDKKVYVVPVRFVVACRNGHLSDFPWADWVRHEDTCKSKKKFKLQSRGPGLAGLFVVCLGCKNERSMEHAFKADAHEAGSCEGERPWLANGKETCTQKPTTMQRGASNLHFPRFESVLVIPPWSEEILKRLGFRWNEIATIDTAENRSDYIEIMWPQIEAAIGDVSKEEFIQLVEEKIAAENQARSGDLRWDEYQQFMLAAPRLGGHADDFEIRSEPVGEDIPHLSKLIRVVSLREIRAFRWFTRIEPYPATPPVKQQFPASRNIGWLPAIEVRGEGIFLELDPVRVDAWAARREVQKHVSKISTYNESMVLNPETNRELVGASVAAKYLLLHALSHILMKQLSLQCGYSAASIRELIYVGDGNHSMSGLLLYTSTSDSDGTLGGLQREGRSERFALILRAAIRNNEWCASDPLCIQGVIASTETSNIACCHSCLLAPETSCTDFNRFLDRSVLVGTPDDPSIGFFRDLLDSR